MKHTFGGDDRAAKTHIPLIYRSSVEKQTKKLKSRLHKHYKHFATESQCKDETNCNCYIFCVQIFEIDYLMALKMKHQ